MENKRLSKGYAEAVLLLMDRLYATAIGEVGYLEYIMRESGLLITPLSSPPDFEPIVQRMRESISFQN